jgi:Trk-type K+ transport system membrane component
MNMLSDSFLSCWLIFLGCSGGMGNILVAYLFLRVEWNGVVVEDKRCVDM